MKFNDRLAACEREDAQPMETIEAFADETVFRNDENGYTVLVIKAGRSRVSAVGIMPPISIGEKLRITGEWTEHPVYGRQIKVQSLEIEKPTTLSGIEKYLSSGMIRGVGPATANCSFEPSAKKRSTCSIPSRISCWTCRASAKNAPA